LRTGDVIGGVLGPLARLPVQAAAGFSRAGASAPSRVTRAVVARPAAALRSVAAAMVGPERQVWSTDGRAQIEVRGLDGSARSFVVRSVEDAVDALAGVAWARVDAVTRRLVVRFDPGRLSLAQLTSAVEAAEGAAGVEDLRYSPEDAGSPGDPRPLRLEALSVAVHAAGLSAAVAGRLLPWPALPGATGAAVVLLDYQPRFRRALEHRLGPAGTDLALAVATAAVQGLTQGVPSLAVDTAQRTQSWLAARARRDAFTAVEAELCGPRRPVPTDPVEVEERPVPVPGGPVERLADRAATGSLAAAAGLLVLTGRVGTAAQAVLVGAPKAARVAREAFADTLTVGLARRGVVVVDDRALRRLDRVTTVLVDSSVLLGSRPLIVEASATADSWTREHVWGAGQRLLADGPGLPIPPPPGRRQERLELVGQLTADAGQLARLRLTEDGQPVGELLVGHEVDPYADAVVGAAQDAGLRVMLTADPSVSELAARADRVLPRPAEAVSALAAQIRELQRDGDVVAVVSGDELALASADVAIGVIPVTGRVPWSADLLCGPGLSDVPRLLAAVPVARSVSHRGVTLAIGASFLGGLLTAVGSGRRGGAVLPIHLAAASAMVSGTLAARRIAGQPGPQPVLHTPWHALEVDDVLDRLPPDPRSEPEPAPSGRRDPLRALGTLGSPLRSAGRLLSNVRAELADPLTPVLATGAAASAVIGSPTDALLVGGVLAANALVSGAQRLRADRALEALLIGQRVTARRLPSPADPGASQQVPADRLVPGDVIELRPGDVVPADGRVLAESGLEVDEASLTGESVAVPKQQRATPGAELADRACMVYEGTTVLAGTGRAVVVAVGATTEAGRALRLAGRSAGPVGMQARLEELTRRGLPITLLGGAAVTGLGMLRGQSIRSAIASGVSVAVAAVPEGLPLVATVAQLSAARRLSEHGVLVRSARTVEALGRVDTVCFDKTGTLTEGRLRLVRVAGLDDDWPLDARPAGRIVRAAALACPHPGPGQPPPHATDQAVLDGARAALGEQVTSDWEELSELPFHSDRGYSAMVGRTGDTLRLVVKGAPEVLLPRCSHVRDEEGRRPLSQAGRHRADDMVHRLAGRGLRVLTVAGRTLPPADGDTPPGPEELAGDLTLLGFIGLADVARAQAGPTVAALQTAGLSVVMITGDHPVTAHAIADSLGIPAARVVTGPELAALDDQARTSLVAQANVFARVSPEQKLRIISALQRAGRVVAMTGDGANDAAAIRLADVGFGMTAHGSTSARSAADVVLTEPDVSLIVDCLIEGRAMWRRVRDSVAILLGGNAGEVAFTLVGTALAGRAPLGTRQFLLVNMLTDLLPAMAISLAATPEDPGARYEILIGGVPSLGAPLLRDIGIRGATTAAGALAAWQIGRFTGTRRRADTIALAALVGTQLGQTLVVGGRNRLVIATGIGSAAALAAVIQTPGVSQFFGCRPLGPVAWTTAVGSAAAATAVSVVAPRLFHPARPDISGAPPAADAQTVHHPPQRDGHTAPAVATVASAP
jgi:cation-transporting ATPase I